MSGLLERIGVWIGYGIGVAICEPQVRLGRRRHDWRCDDCGDEISRYGEERLRFPDTDPDTIRGKIARLTQAEYECFCLECSADRED